MIRFATNVCKQYWFVPIPTGPCSSASNGDPLGKICQSLNDLQKKTNIIKRDGSIIPISSTLPLEITGVHLQ